MGSCSEANTGQGIDASVGGLVWVRRRNGCWWPGRIMGVDELAESGLVSSRAGTPVKLLGRGGPSVDWYNLEKSKRVKAFRCGDYDECIEKAKASAANSSKKLVKYARREDAILHALQLESDLQTNGHSNFCLKLDKPDAQQHSAKRLPTMLHSSEETEDMDEVSSSFQDISDSALEFSQSGVSFEEPNHVGASMEQSLLGSRRRTPNDSEDDGTEGVKRMKGLEDLGMGVVSTLNRKRSQVLNCHGYLKKRKNRRLPLAKVLESTSMVSVPVMCEQLASPSSSPLPGVSDCMISGVGSNESKGKISIAINNNSDCTGVTCENGTLLKVSSSDNQKENEISSSSMLGLPETESSDRLFDVPFARDEKHAGGSPVFASCSSQKLHHVVGGTTGAQSSQSSQVETTTVSSLGGGNEECNESASTNSAAADLINIARQRVVVDTETSKWLSKRKRNSRHKTKFIKQDSGAALDDESSAYINLISRGSRYFHKYLSEFSETPRRALPHRHARLTLNPKYHMADFEIEDYNTGSILYEVNLEVRASSYRPHNVPYVSITSKLNDHSITGLPLNVEVLDDGCCDQLVHGGHESYSTTSTSCELDVDDVDDDDDDDDMGSSADLWFIPKPKQGGQSRVSPNKSPKKKKKNGFSSKKIRKLSSLGGGGFHKKNKEEKNSVVVEKMVKPVVACVPLNVVFSRLNASMTGFTRSVVMSRDQ